MRLSRSRCAFVVLLVLVSCVTASSPAVAAVSGSSYGSSCAVGLEGGTTAGATNVHAVMRMKCFLNPASGDDAKWGYLASLTSYTGSGMIMCLNYPTCSVTADSSASTNGTPNVEVVERGRVVQFDNTVLAAATGSGLPDNYVEFALMFKWQSGAAGWGAVLGSTASGGWGGQLTQIPIGGGHVIQCCVSGADHTAAMFFDIAGSGAAAWDAAVPEEFDNWGGFVVPGESCSSLTSVDVAIRQRIGEFTDWTDLADPAGFTVKRTDQVRFTIDADGSQTLQFMLFWNPANRVTTYFNGGLPVEDYPLVDQFEHPGPPQDLGAATIACYNVDTEVTEFYNLADGGWGDGIPTRRPCQNIMWTWPEIGDRFRTDQDYAFFLEFPIDGEAISNAHEGEVIGFYFDADDGDNYLEHIAAVDSDTWETAIDTIWRSDGSSETLPYDPESGEDFYIGLSFDESPDLDPSRTGFWCVDDSGEPPVLYRLDSTYEAIDPLNPTGGSAASAGCFQLSSMSLTSPKSWVTGIGEMLTCLVKWLVIPDAERITTLVAELVGETQEQFPFSIGWMMVDFAETLGDELASPSGTGCFNMPANFSFGEFSVAAEDMCIGDGLEPSSPQRQAVAALMIAPLLWGIATHAVKTARNG